MPRFGISRFGKNEYLNNFMVMEGFTVMNQVYALGAPGGGGGGGAAGGDFSFIIMMAILFGIFYFLLIRPQQKKQKEIKNKNS